MTRVSPRELLRQLTFLAIAMVTVVCAGLVGRGGLSGGASPVEIVAVAGASDARWAPAPQGSSQWRRGIDLPDFENDALEADLDDDDRDDRDDDDFGENDARSTLAHEQAVALRHAAFPRKPARALSSEHRLDPSRFVAGTRLPRGPPTA